MKNAIGMVETRSLVGAIEAADAMLKTSNVKLVDFDFVGSGVVSVTVEGDVGAVKAAVDVGQDRASKVSELISFNVLPRPHSEVEKLF